MIGSSLGSTHLPAILDRDGLDLAVLVEDFVSFLAAVSGLLESSEGELDASTRSVVVDVYLADLQLVGEPVGLADIARPHTGLEDGVHDERHRARHVCVSE